VIYAYSIVLTNDNHHILNTKLPLQSNLDYKKYINQCWKSFNLNEKLFKNIARI